MIYSELNMDGLVGPTHHYAGLALGNMASVKHSHRLANPRAAALQGLDKIELAHRLGIKQAILPPHQRPHQQLLSQLGFSGTLAQQLQQVHQANPDLLSACFSAASMWTANMATLTPSIDSTDHKLHITPANLVQHLHRSIETDFSARLLKYIFADEKYFTHHEPLYRSVTMSDEGAANHSRICHTHASAGIHLFVYGKRTLPSNNHLAKSKRFPARQTFEASTTIARRHCLSGDNSLFWQQNPRAIDAGVFHNDVIAVANENLMLLHESAFVDQASNLRALREKINFPVHIIEVKQHDVPLSTAVSSYMFNSQIITSPNGRMVMLAPQQCQTQDNTRHFIEALVADSSNPIDSICYQNLQQSMQNGGGPACLRLRVVLSADELQHMHQGIIVTDALLSQLRAWVQKNYRDRLQHDDLIDPNLIDETYHALDELSQLLQLGSIYPFQE